MHALQYLQSRVSLQLLPGGVSWTWLTSLATVPKLAVNGVARFAVLRWAVNEDDDECLRLRIAGSLQAEQPCQLTPACIHPDLILPQPVKDAAMITISMQPPCAVVRDGEYRPHPTGTPSRTPPGDIFLFLPHGETAVEISLPA